MSEQAVESREPFVDIRTAAQFLGVKRSWLYEQVRLGKVPSFKFGIFRRFRLSELERWATHKIVEPTRTGQGAI